MWKNMEKSDVFLGGDGRIGVCRVNAYDAIVPKIPLERL